MESLAQRAEAAFKALMNLQVAPEGAEAGKKNISQTRLKTVSLAGMDPPCQVSHGGANGYVDAVHPNGFPCEEETGGTTPGHSPGMADSIASPRRKTPNRSRPRRDKDDKATVDDAEAESPHLLPR